MTYEELLSLNKVHNSLKRSHMNLFDDYKDNIDDEEIDTVKKSPKEKKKNKKFYFDWDFS